MFNKEFDLLNTFLSHLQANQLSFGEVEFQQEFDYVNGRTDVIAKTTNNEIIAFEAKLKNISKVINQAYRNTAFANKSYIVLPSSLEKREKHYSQLLTDTTLGLIFVSTEASRIAINAKENIPVLPWLNERAHETLN